MKFIRVIVLLVVLFMVSCGKSGGIKNLNDLSGRTLGIKKGTVVGDLALGVIPTAKLKFFPDLDAMLIDLQRGGIDAMVDDVPALINLAAKKPGLMVLPKLITEDDYAFATAQNRPEMKAVVDKVIQDIKRDGTYTAMINRWFPEVGEPGKMPEIRLEAKNGILKFGTAAVTEPFAFFDSSGKVVGFDVELAHYVARELGMGIEVKNMPFRSLLPNVIAHKVDIVGGCITITAAREQHVLFSISNYQGGVGALVLK